ncbi:MAG: hypothetical protein ABIP51_11770 [Bacteroidia bacterium]
MENFEIHITGSSPEIINNLRRREIKTIIIDLLKPSGEIVATEYMSSIVKEFFNIDECKKWVQGLVNSLLFDKIDITRIKIESPFYPHYVSQSLYIESHFITSSYDYPISRNVASNKLIATDREYDISKFNSFKDKYINEEVELCLFDNNINGDKKWFDLYKKH